MDFDITEEQELLLGTVAQLVENECPLARVREIFDGDSGHDPEFWKSLVEIGLAGTAIPEEFGGAGLELLDLALVAESLGNGAAPGPILGHSLAGLALLLGGSDEQKKTWLPRLAMGEVIGTVAFAEQGGWQPDDWTLRTNGTLSGVKNHVPFGSLADLIVVGTTDGGLVLVERGSAVKTEPIDGADRTRRLDKLSFEGAPFERLPDGQKASGRVRDAGLILLSADAYGGAARCVEMAAGLREHTSAVRRDHRPLPGHQASALEHGDQGRSGALPVLVRGPRIRPHPGGVGAYGCTDQGARHVCVHADRPRHGRSSRRHRLHLGV